MKLTFIGTGSGKVNLKYYHTSFFLQSGKIGLLIDSGDSVSKALLQSEISLNTISHILISHNHPDHFSGLPNLINQMHLGNRKKKLIIYTHKNLVEITKDSLSINFVFLEKLKFDLEIIGFDYGKDFNVCDSLKITPIKNNHIKNKYKTKSIDESCFVSSSFLIGNLKKNVLITSDLGDEKDLELFDPYSPDVLIIESTHVDLQAAFNFEIIKNSAKIFLTHYDDNNLRQIQRVIQKKNNDGILNIFIGHERQRINI